jgi:hypothetical protein
MNWNTRESDVKIRKKTFKELKIGDPVWLFRAGEGVDMSFVNDISDSVHTENDNINWSFRYSFEDDWGKSLSICNDNLLFATNHEDILNHEMYKEWSKKK